MTKLGAKDEQEENKFCPMEMKTIIKSLYKTTAGCPDQTRPGCYLPLENWAHQTYVAHTQDDALYYSQQVPVKKPNRLPNMPDKTVEI